ncbi:hypothetical protein BSIN_1642 [Burkholderia singularis]|uniref:Uncharacterized protein n=1 Tax=Burkholderia singularis TaxID=1503053 RepID=A0A238GZE5_9BURK|nr:hypothetical protein BSIN_1642 [Burkholderia singularis]
MRERQAPQRSAEPNDRLSPQLHVRASAASVRLSATSASASRSKSMAGNASRQR